MTIPGFATGLGQQLCFICLATLVRCHKVTVLRLLHLFLASNWRFMIYIGLKLPLRVTVATVHTSRNSLTEHDIGLLRCWTSRYHYFMTATNLGVDLCILPHLGSVPLFVFPRWSGGFQWMRNMEYVLTHYTKERCLKMYTTLSSPTRTLSPMSKPKDTTPTLPDVDIVCVEFCVHKLLNVPRVSRLPST